jgi:hypothetical protein
LQTREQGRAEKIDQQADHQQRTADEMHWLERLAER